MHILKHIYETILETYVYVKFKKKKKKIYDYFHTEASAVKCRYS